MPAARSTLVMELPPHADVLLALAESGSGPADPGAFERVRWRVALAIAAAPCGALRARTSEREGHP